MGQPKKPTDGPMDGLTTTTRAQTPPRRPGPTPLSHPSPLSSRSCSSVSRAPSNRSKPVLPRPGESNIWNVLLDLSFHCKVRSILELEWSDSDVGNLPILNAPCSFLFFVEHSYTSGPGRSWRTALNVFLEVVLTTSTWVPVRPLALVYFCLTEDLLPNLVWLATVFRLCLPHAFSFFFF